MSTKMLTVLNSEISFAYGGTGQCTCSEAGRTLSLRRPCPISSVCECRSLQARLYPNSHVLPGICRTYHRGFGESGEECDPEAGECPQWRPKRQTMQAMTHVAVQDRHCAPERRV